MCSTQPESGQDPMDSLPIPDELLLDIFRRISSPTDLVRTSAACVTFRRLIADRSFLRRYRKLHAPPLLGLLDDERKVFHPADPPHPSAPAASALALAADFSFSFLPVPANGWEIEDTRDGRVLLLDRPRIQQHTDSTSGIRAFWEIAVCDPLHRRYVLVPRLPEHLVASVMEKPIWKSEAFLIPSDNDEETSFRVMLMGQGETELFAFVFSSNTGQWRAIPSMSLIDLLAGLHSSTYYTFNSRTNSSGCFYWLCSPTFFIEEMKMLVFDTRRMEFSVAEPPPEAKSSRGIAMVEAEEGRHGMFVLESGPPNFRLYYYIMQNNGGSASQWHREKTISLSQGYCYKRSFSPGIAYELSGSVGERYLLLLQLENYSLEPNCFTLDIKTFQLERVCSRKFGHGYSNFPPSLLSSPTVSSGTQEGAEKERLEQGMEALRVDESIAADGAGRAGVLRIGDGVD